MFSTGYVSTEGGITGLFEYNKEEDEYERDKSSWIPGFLQNMHHEVTLRLKMKQRCLDSGDLNVRFTVEMACQGY